MAPYRIESLIGERLAKAEAELDRVYTEFEPVSIVESEADQGEEYDLRLADADTTQGSAGLSGYWGGGVATNKDQNPLYSPFRARGLAYNLGLYHQTFLESDAFRNAWRRIVEGIQTGFWFVEPARISNQDYAKAQAAHIESLLFNLDRGWSQHVQEALYLLVAGFAPFVIEYDGLGQVASLNFRFPSQVSKWVTDKSESRVVGIEFAGTSTSGAYFKSAADLVIYQLHALGNDFEGMSPLRAVYRYIQIHQLVAQLEAVAAEKYGGGIMWVEKPVGAPMSKDQDAALSEALDELEAADNPVITMPSGFRLNLISPSGTMPNMEPIKRYCDERIKEALDSAGSLVGLNGGGGSYALAEVKDKQELRSLGYYAGLICDVLNSGSRVAYTGLIRYMVDHSPYPCVDGQYPRVAWLPAQPQKEEGAIESVVGAAAAGLLSWGADDEDWLRERLGLPVRTLADDEADAAQVATLGVSDNEPVESAQDAALNGAQIAAMISIAQAVWSGSVSLDAGVAMMMRGLLVDEATARRLIGQRPEEGDGNAELD
jgi:hypothetical protein